MTISHRSASRIATGVATLAIAAVVAGPASAADRNHDRIPDRWEVKHNLSLSQNQARKDQDRDGLRNRGEFEGSMDPHDADTDGDGVEDGVEGAGTVASFDATSGELVINLFSGDSVTGTVTSDTEIDCNNDDGVQPDDHGDDPSGHDGTDDNGDDGPGHDGTDDNGDDGPGHDRSAISSGGGDDEGSDDDNCSTADLVSGAIVREAQLDATASGLVYDEIELR
jgi:hypothetical protein